MPSRTALGLTGALVLGLAAIIFAAVAMARVNELSLPLPASLPALNLLIPIVTAIAWPSARKTVRSVQKHALRLALPYLASASTFAPFILLILSLVYSIPSDIQSCAADQHWLRMFEDKDSRSIRSIQARLQCCGFNSMHDRAWPFPSHDADARTCERTQGYTIACGTTWRQEESLAAALCAVASFLNWLAMVIVVATFPQDEGNIRLPAWTSQTTTRLIEGSDGQAETSGDNVAAGARTEHNRNWNNNVQEAEH